MQNQQRSDKPQNSPQKSLTKIFNQQVTSIHYLYPQAKSQKNIKLYNKKNTQNHKINTTSLKEKKIHTLVSELLTENHGNTVHDKLKVPPCVT